MTVYRNSDLSCEKFDFSEFDNDIILFNIESIKRKMRSVSSIVDL